MVDVLYVRGWQDCLEALDLMLAKAKSLEDAKRKIQKLEDLIKENKYEKIRTELGAFDLF